MTLPTIRSTVGRTLLPATVLYSVALLWSDAEGIRAKLVLRDLAQNSITLPRAEIKDLKAMPVSLMPEGITDALTDQQVRDLFAYLMGK